ncbi:MAG: CpaF family protein [Candidatus Dormibacteraeota bacterium]|nr:CpaF family protein [Candidatus Dormibacteraeota bacterium]
MSLLDRVQRRAEGSTPLQTVPTPAPRPVQPAPPAQPAEPAPQVAEAPRPAAVAPPSPARPRPAEGGEPPRQNSLLNRTGLGRTGLGKGPTGVYSALRAKVHQRLVEELAGDTESTPAEKVRQRIAELLNEVVAEQAITMGRQEKARVVEIIVNDVLGLGPLEDLLANADVTEIMVNGYNQIYIEQRGKITLSPVTFESNDHLMQVIDRIVSSIGRRVDESSPMVDARLQDGSRVNVIIPPLALRGPTVTIRKFAKEALTIDDLTRFESITDDMVRFLRACVRARFNIVVSGGTGSGKTTTLNILSGFIPHDERIVTIEDAAELQLRQDHVVTLETRPANVEGRGRISIRDLVINSLRMRPDRIVVGECRGGEALDMLQAMNTGHDGSLTTLHANNPRDCVSRLETLVLMAGAELPSRAIREQIGSAVNVIVQQSRLRDGSRKIVSITEVLGSDGNEVRLQELFTFRQTGVDGDGHVQGFHTPTGAVPTFMEHLTTSGEGLPEEIFQPVHVVENAG